MKPVRIGKKLVGPGQPVFIIAEIGINHNGNVAIAKKLIDLAVEHNVDAVKFQTRTVPVVYTPSELAKPRSVPKDILENAIRRGVLSEEAVRRLMDSDFEESTNGDLKTTLEFTDQELGMIDQYCHQMGIMWLTSCWDAASFDRLERFNLPCHKIASACNQDDELLRRARATGKPIILSTGMSDLAGVRETVELLGTENLIILHCTSVYPQGTEYGDEILRLINLRGQDTLLREFDVPVGFSNHNKGIMPAYAAVARGACVLEVHITLGNEMWGSDQGSSLEPMELLRLCRATRELEIALGDGQIVVYPGEEEAAKKLRRVHRVQASV